MTEHIFEVIIAALLAIIAYFLKTKDHDVKSQIKDLTKDMRDLNLSLNTLNVTIKFLIERTDQIPRIKEDISALHSKFRDLKN